MMRQIIFFICVLFALQSCASHQKSHAYAKNSSKARFDWIGENTNDKLFNQIETETNHTRIIYNADLNVTVTSVDSANKSLVAIALKHGGYSQTTGDHRSVIRVKAENLQAAIKEISSIGKITYKNVSGEDVSESLTNFEIRLENANKARARYLELLAKAENVEAALKVEKELERVNLEIETLQGSIKRMEHLIAYSTITISLDKKIKPGILGYLGIGIYRTVKWFIVRN